MSSTSSHAVATPSTSHMPSPARESAASSSSSNISECPFPPAPSSSPDADVSAQERCFEEAEHEFELALHTSRRSATPDLSHGSRKHSTATTSSQSTFMDAARHYSRHKGKSDDEDDQGTLAGEDEEARVGEEGSEKKQHGGHQEDDDIVWVEWDSPADPANPRNWSVARKWVLCSLGIMFCALVSMSVSGYAIAQGSVQTAFNAPLELVVAGVSLFTITFGSAPLILAPFSEVYGRAGLYIISAFGFAIFFLPQALATNIETILVCRFISGIWGSNAISLVGGTITDLFTSRDLGLAMSAFSWSAFAFTGVGPMAFGYVEQNLNFRYVNWIMFALSMAFAIFVAVISRETRASALLSRKAKKLRKTTGLDRYQCRADAERASLAVLIKVSLFRPLRLLLTEPVLIAFAVWIALVWAVVYLLFESIPLVFEEVYGFSIGETGLVFTTQFVGSTLGWAANLYCERLYQQQRDTRGPEGRLYAAMLGGMVLPVANWWYVWTARPEIHWMCPCVALVFVYGAMYLIYLACFSYIADSYQIYASSALSAQNFLRNAFGAAAPLFAHQMYNGLGIYWAGTLVSALLTVFSATPFVLFFYGARLREKSKFSKEVRRLAGEKA